MGIFRIHVHSCCKLKNTRFPACFLCWVALHCEGVIAIRGVTIEQHLTANKDRAAKWQQTMPIARSALNLSLSNITYTPCLTLVARCSLPVGAGICQVCLQCVALGPSQVESVHFSLESLICCRLLAPFFSSLGHNSHEAIDDLSRGCVCVCAPVH